MKKIPLNISAIQYSQSQNGAFALILKEVGGERNLPIVVGPFEAQSISIAMEKEIMLPRPLTHDLMANLLDMYKIAVEEAIIFAYQDNLFYAKLILVKDGEKQELECRTSDAVAIAIRVSAPIYTFDEILNQTTIFLDDEEEEEEEEIIEIHIDGLFDEAPEQEMNMENMEQELLEIALQKAIEDEDFETAAKLRDLINKRNN